MIGPEWLAIDWQQVGVALAAVGATAASAWAWWTNRAKNSALSRADIAEANAETTVADAQSTVYKMLTDRLSTLEIDVQGLRAELSVERAHSRKLEIHIFKLENLMRANGMEPPVFGG